MSSSVGAMSWFRRAFYYSEQVVRILLLNVPLAFRLVPEFNAFSKYALSYLNLQVLGFIWAILLNASFAMACRVTYILPDIKWSSELARFYIDTDRNFSDTAQTSQILFAFYVQYASLKVVATYGLNVLRVVLLSMSPIRPRGSAAAADPAFKSHRMMPLLKIMLQLSYVPSIIVCSCLLGADSICLSLESSSSSALPSVTATDLGSSLGVASLSGMIMRVQTQIRSLLCARVGLSYLTSPNTQLRRAVLFVAVVLLINNVQAFLYVFTNWGELVADRRRLSVRSSVCFQIGAILLSAVSLTLLPMVLGIDFLPTGDVTGETFVCALSLAWAVWLYAAIPALTDGFRWTQSMDNKDGHSAMVVAAAHVASIVRLTQVLAYACLFTYTLVTRGLLQAQLDLTFVTFLLPGFICAVYTIGTKLVRILDWVKTPAKLLVCLALCAITAWIVSAKLAGSDSKGGLLFVFLHLVIKLSSLVEEEDQEEYEESHTPLLNTPVPATAVAGTTAAGNKSRKLVQASAGGGISGANASASASRGMGGAVLFPTDPREEEGEEEGEGGGQKPIDQPRNGTSSPNPNPSPSPSPARQWKSTPRRGLAPVSEAEAEIEAEGSGSSVSPQAGSDSASLPSISADSSEPDVLHGSSSSSICSSHSSGGDASSEALSPVLSSRKGLSAGGGGGRDRSNSELIDDLYLTRDKPGNPLAQISTPAYVKRHFFVRLCRQQLRYIGAVWRVLFTWKPVDVDNAYNGKIRIFMNLLMLLTLMLVVFGLGAHVQRTAELFPTVMRFHAETGADGEVASVRFDHAISNVTLQLSSAALRSHRRPATAAAAAAAAASGYQAGWQQQMLEERELPHYISCDLRWGDLSVLDFAILSEIAYMEDGQGHSRSRSRDHGGGEGASEGSGSIQEIVNTLFPDDDFVVKHSSAPQTHIGPRYFEVYSRTRNITVVAVRGTDVGRLQDVLEDAKLFAEPIMFDLLSIVFPTVRLWNHEMTATITKCIYEFNTFLGLQGEAEYYQPLAQRVYDIAAERGSLILHEDSRQRRQQQHATATPAAAAAGASHTCTAEDGRSGLCEGALNNPELLNAKIPPSPPQPEHRLIITGHSLGGGLARIVGTLLQQVSLSFEPPGLGTSYRKYSVDVRDQRGEMQTLKVRRDFLDHESFALVTAFDPVPHVDQQVGLIQNIQCDHKDTSINSFACHLLEGTICHLIKHCGDPRGRFVGCDSTFELSAMGPSLRALLWRNKWISVPALLIAGGGMLLAIVPEFI